ncbi:MAG: PEP-CTERM sorting domain-containing protein [Pirellulales bacterium]|nr:PEP-CTERM sorting domain-containing protein [Pirellulales bacterium]
MQRFLNGFALLCLLAPVQASGAVILSEDFEDNTLTFSVSDGLFFDTGNDFFHIVPLNGVPNVDDGPYTGFGGSNFFAAEDINDPQGPNVSGVQTLFFEVNIAGFTDLTFSGLFAAGSHDVNNGDTLVRYDVDDGVRVRAQIDDGPIQNLLFLEAFQGADDFNEQLGVDTDFDGTADGAVLTNVASAFNDISITGTGSELVLTIEVAMDANNEEVAFDNITVSGTPTVIAPVPEPATILAVGLAGVCMGVRRRKTKTTKKAEERMRVGKP